MKSRRILTILLSLAIMLSFMPAMAFAAGASPASTKAGHSWDTAAGKAAIESAGGIYFEHGYPGEIGVPATYKGLKVLVAPTCTEDGVGTIPCTTALNDEDCTGTRTVVIQRTGHDYGNKVKKSVADMMTYLGMTNAQKAAWYKTHTGTNSDYCYGYVYVCKDCGKWLDEYGYLVDSVSDAFDTVEHLAPNDTPACALNFTCKECTREKVTNSIFPATNPQHDWDEKVEKAHWSGKGTANEKYVQVTSRTCKKCGYAPDTVREYVPSDGVFEHPNTTTIVKTEATCAAAGEKWTVCADCGEFIESNPISKLAHTYAINYATYSKLPQNIKDYGKDADGAALITNDTVVYAYDKCLVCDAADKTSAKAVSFSPDVPTTIELAAPANCEQGAWVVLEQDLSSYGAQYGLERAIINDSNASQLTKVAGRYYIIENNKKTEVPYAEATGHDWGTTTAIAPATCTKRALEGRTCSVCGQPDHHATQETGAALGHTIKEVVVPATCGTAGYTYKVCETCNLYAPKNAKTGDTIAAGYTKELTAAQMYDETKPVVSLGTECQYAWTTLEEPTPFAMGTRAKVCTVCGHELIATKESIAKTKIAAPAVKPLKKKAKVTVKAVPGAVKYQILVNGKVSKTVKKAGTFTVKKYVKSSKKGTANKFQIRAINADKVKATSKATTKKIKK